MEQEQEQVYLSKAEIKTISEALIEYWQNNMKHAKESQFKVIAEYLKDDFKEKSFNQ